MANSSKNKGDRYERAAVAYLLETVPDLNSVKKAMRYLGAGRKEDVGDLNYFIDVAVQVKAWADMGQGIRAAASGSVIQAGHADVPFALGMVPIQGARKGKVNWLASVAVGRWPVPVEPVAEFAMVSKALAWLKTDEAPYGFRAWERDERIGLLAGPGEPALVAPIEAWFKAYREATGRDTRLSQAA